MADEAGATVGRVRNPLQVAASDEFPDQLSHHRVAYPNAPSQHRHPGTVPVELLEYLRVRRRAVTGIVLGGVMTSMSIESTARGACDRGYNVTFAESPMTDPNPQTHHHSLQTIFPAIGTDPA